MAILKYQKTLGLPDGEDAGRAYLNEVNCLFADV
jgi:hypothetical protein